MCGRFTFSVDPTDLTAVFPWLSIACELRPRFNIAPTQEVAAVANTGADEVELFRWGLIPSWSEDAAISARLVNARAETLAEKPSFRAAFRRRRCLVLADGFFEWRKETPRGRKWPYYIRLKSHAPFAFAGLWESWRSPDGATIRSCAIVTTTPNSLVAPIHDRMPVILAADDARGWIGDAETPVERISSMLRPFPAGEMEAFPVSPLVNNPKYDSPACIAPASAT